MAKEFEIVKHPPVPDAALMASSKDFEGLLANYQQYTTVNNGLIGGINIGAIVFSFLILGYNLVSEPEMLKTSPEFANKNAPAISPPAKNEIEEVKDQNESREAEAFVAAKKEDTKLKSRKSGDIQIPTPIQEDTGDIPKTPVITSAQPIQGMEHLYQYFEDSLRYPTEMRDSGISGEVVIAFTIGTTGEVSDIEIISSMSKAFDEEAKRVLMNMPEWKPATVNGHPITSQLSLPLIFTSNKTNKHEK